MKGEIKNELKRKNKEKYKFGGTQNYNEKIEKASKAELHL